MSNDTQFDFKKLIVEARTPPEIPETTQGSAVELPKLFEEPSKTPPIMSTEVSKDKVSIEVAMEQQTRVFTLWRPWEECTRCRNDMDGTPPKVILPDEGEYMCPHVQLEVYKNTIDMCLRGDAVLTNKEYFNLPNGTRCVHIEWMVADPVAMRKLKQNLEEKKKNQVWPPDVEGAFEKKSPAE